MTVDLRKELDDLFSVVFKEGASDIHISEGRQPIIRVSGFLLPITTKQPTSKQDVNGIIDILLTPENKKRFLENKEVDFAYHHKEKIRFRGNAFFQRGFISISLRLVPHQVKSLKELNLPPILEMFAKRQQGFFVVVGPTGHGKSTTLACLIDMINSERLEHIITIEDPIEYIFDQKKSIIDQREVRTDTPDFHTALRGVFRQDIDVLMIGEMREPETISTAVTAAETGHLVLSTLHTNTAAQTIDRIIDSFSGDQQSQIRFQLSASLTGIFSQRLIPRISGGLIPAYELLISNNAIANLIREGRTHEINTVIETSSQEGMIDLNHSLAGLVRAGEITIENALLYSVNARGLEKML